MSIRLPGTNANEDGTVTNHGIVNPDYTQNVQHLWWAATLLRAGRQSVPESLFLNADIVYRALAVVDFSSPPYAPPGGTVCAPGGQIYYPMGVSWGVRRPASFCGCGRIRESLRGARYQRRCIPGSARLRHPRATTTVPQRTDITHRAVRRSPTVSVKRNTPSSRWHLPGGPERGRRTDAACRSTPMPIPGCVCTAGTSSMRWVVLRGGRCLILPAAWRST